MVPQLVRVRTDEGHPSSPGAQPYVIEIHGLEAGETIVRVLSCTRVHEVSENCYQSQGTLDAPVEPVEITVRVG